MKMTKERKEYLYDYQKKNLKRVPLDLTKEYYKTVADAARASGMSVNGYIKAAIKEKIERDSKTAAE